MADQLGGQARLPKSLVTVFGRPSISRTGLNAMMAHDLHQLVEGTLTGYLGLQLLDERSQQCDRLHFQLSPAYRPSPPPSSQGQGKLTAEAKTP